MKISLIRGLTTILMTIFALIGGGIYHAPQEINDTIAREQPTPTSVPGVADSDWVAYGRSSAGERYSPLTQINTNNVNKLKVAWVYHTEDMKTDDDSGESTYEVTPLKVGDKLFLCTLHQRLDALDAATGKRLWRFDPKIASTKQYQHLTCRGVSYYDADTAAQINPKSASLSTSTASLECPRKVILPVNDGRLITVNADNGKPCSDFETKLGDSLVAYALDEQK
ncbi:PQQ-binding-like beta-propeller repeat protein [Pelistega europaea]|uniref:PQQ-binding-like beta-propeller repeat protein n=1 Tax=Pelistega europaea TaxID=106147 RepID=A0A7Y4P433_9BURK|nr:PQQ-binding-like beta-propeller repeat protein [Pelistega europaea]NOL49677.1 PQQ-binding-like beta-propeller repeat protein [Pelistega europaea]